MANNTLQPEAFLNGFDTKLKTVLERITVEKPKLEHFTNEMPQNPPRPTATPPREGNLKPISL